MIITVTLNPAIDKTATVKTMVVNGLNRLENITLDVGGKGINVAKALNALDYRRRIVLLGFLAGQNGKWIESQLQYPNFHLGFIEVDGNTRMNLKVIDEHKNLTELNEPGIEIKKEDLNRFKRQLINLAQANDIVVLAGSVPKGVPKTIYQELIVELKKKDAIVLLDADGDLFRNGVQAGPTLIKPNKYELCQYFGLNEDISDEELITHAKSLFDFGIEYIVISLGAQGAIFMTTTETLKIPGLKVHVLSSVGAGDTMVGALAYGLDQQLTIQKTAKLAMASSAAACMTEGTKAPEMKEVEKLLNQIEIIHM